MVCYLLDQISQKSITLLNKVNPLLVENVAVW